MKMGKPQFNVGDVYDEKIASQPEEVIKDNLEGISYHVKEEGYTKHLTSEELNDRKTDLANVSIELARLEEEKKMFMEIHKEKLREPNNNKKELLQTIKLGAEHRIGMLYEIDDQENGYMYTFDSEANCVGVRSLKPNEKQLMIKNEEIDGTNG